MGSRRQLPGSIGTALTFSFEYKIGFPSTVRNLENVPVSNKQAALGLSPPAWISVCTPPLRTRASGRLAGLTFAVKDNMDVAGMPLNPQLTERGAHLVHATTTARQYRLYALPNTTPSKPGLKRVATHGAAIALEVWDMPISQLGSFLALIPAPLGLGKVELADGSWVTGFICEGLALDAAQDVTAHGGWRAYIQSLNPSFNP
jgi:hypothetical protein